MNVPKIRLKGFEGEWSNCFVKDVLQHEASSLAQNQLGEDKGEYPVYGASGFVQHIESYAQAQDYIGVVKDGAGVGRINLYPAYSSVLGTLHYLKASGSNDIHFLSNLLQTKDLTLFTTGSTIPHIYFKDYADMEISVPSADEQQQIAEYFGQLDSLIEATGKKIALLKQTKQACLQQMFPAEGETTPRVRFKGFEGEWKAVNFGNIIDESLDRSTIENEDILLSSAINGMFLNSELFGHQRGKSNIGYRKIKRNMLVLSAQNLHLGNANVNLRFEHGLVSPAYKVYNIKDCSPDFLAIWVKREETKSFFLNATTAGASLCRKNIEWRDLYKQQLLIPAEEAEQQQIAAFFSNMDKQIRIQEQRLEKLKQIKAACLENMFV